MYPIYLGEDGGAEQEFDPNADFALFLEEAKTHACEGESQAATATGQQIEENGRRTQSNGIETSNRKSWKSSLFSWLNNPNKKKVEPLQGATTGIPKLRRGGDFSGPVHSGRGLNAGSRSRKTTSSSSGALLTSIFNPAAKREELDGIGIPYVSLSHLNNPPPPGAQSYGPVYLVT